MDIAIEGIDVIFMQSQTEGTQSPAHSQGESECSGKSSIFPQFVERFVLYAPATDWCEWEQEFMGLPLVQSFVEIYSRITCWFNLS